MADEQSFGKSTGAAISSTDVNSLIKLMLGANMDGILGGGRDSTSGLVGGLILGSLLRNNGNLFGGNGVDTIGHSQNSDRAAIESAVSAALAQNNQANNNAMILLKDIQDTGQDVVAAINASENSINSNITNGNQNLIVQFLQGQIANLQGQSDIKSAIAASTATVVNETHEQSAALTAQLNQVNTNMLNGFNALSSKIDANLITELNNEIAALRTSKAVDSGNVTVTNNINQMQQQQQLQTQINQVIGILPGILSELQQAKNSMVNIGGLIAASPQTASPIRVS